MDLAFRQSRREPVATRAASARRFAVRLGLTVALLDATATPGFAAPAAGEGAQEKGRFSIALDALQIVSSTARVRADWALSRRLHAGLLVGAGRPHKDGVDEYTLFEVGGQASWHLLGDRWRGVGALGQVLWRSGSGKREKQPQDAAIDVQGTTALAHVGVFGRYGSQQWPLYMELALLYGYARSSGEAVQGSSSAPLSSSGPDGRASLYLGARF